MQRLLDATRWQLDTIGNQGNGTYKPIYNSYIGKLACGCGGFAASQRAGPTYSSRKTLAGSILAIFSAGRIVAAATTNASAITTADNVDVS